MNYAIQYFSPLVTNTILGLVLVRTDSMFVDKAMKSKEQSLCPNLCLFSEQAPWQSEAGEDGGKDCASGAKSADHLIY